MKSIMELQIVEFLKNHEYSLNTVNNYGENLLHLSVSNKCYEITKIILEQNKDSKVINRKNVFGWTPLMQAICNKDTDTVDLLLKYNANTDESTYLGMSVLGLASSIDINMFEIIYNSDPLALMHSDNDDITPLGIAAMKNDQELFLHLINLGMDLTKTNVYTRFMMQRSTISNISKIVENLHVDDDYWKDTSDNIPIRSKLNKNKKRFVCEDDYESDEKPFKKYKKRNLYLDVFDNTNVKSSSALSPRLNYIQDEFFSESPNGSPISLPKFKLNRPPDLILNNNEIDTELYFDFEPEFELTKSPNLPSGMDDEDVCGEDTPTPPRYKTPPRGMILDSQQAELVYLLKRFELNHHISIFLEQEVDIDLFVTLTDNDLIEIGIIDKFERKALLSVVNEFTKN